MKRSNGRKSNKNNLEYFIITSQDLTSKLQMASHSLALKRVIAICYDKSFQTSLLSYTNDLYDSRFDCAS